MLSPLLLCWVVEYWERFHRTANPNYQEASHATTIRKIATWLAIGLALPKSFKPTKINFCTLPYNQHEVKQLAAKR